MVARYLRSNLNAASARSGPVGLVVGCAWPQPASATTCRRRSILQSGQIGSFSSSTTLRGTAKQPHHHRSPNSQSTSPREGKKSSSSISSSNASSPSCAGHADRERTSANSSKPSSRRSDAAHGREVLGDVNPPTTTLPAQLETPKKPSSPGLQYYMSLGRAYWVFYKTGVKNIWHNCKESRPLRERLGVSLLNPPRISAREFITHCTTLGPLVPLRTALGGKSAAQRRQAEIAKYVHGTDRRGLQLLVRSARDARKSIPFLLVLAVCGELTPFVVALGVIKPPRVCALPSHAEKQRAERIRTKESLRAAMERRGVREGLFSVAGYPADLGGLVARTSPTDVLLSAHVLGVSRKPGFAAQWILPLRLVKDTWCGLSLYSHLVYLGADDALIMRGGGVERLSAEEVRVALDERGGVEVMGKSEREQRAWLERWVRASRKTLSKELGTDV